MPVRFNSQVNSSQIAGVFLLLAVKTVPLIATLHIFVRFEPDDISGDTCKQEIVEHGDDVDMDAADWSHGNFDRIKKDVNHGCPLD